ncbi:unnamed protein product [Rotaria magnacalcarata]|uniref:mitogen-activated protein kinase kinase n=1 Tax=Rotaria magnacalcarata TaxID=392030 RepID=A0A815WKE7_9BILA|nr:unnamed protein product [Rotaria magnacalcarata]CAF1544572.1 unnamed protein product [Rotaria magnacalcarata]CAF2073427.1 unnamed protein product [Rotaria magnacalcarata]CAF2074174.1 unnamed protein product [Rotaria magnacalcarata]CAF2243239.1 unnamed protein product [Rotaria magnacalcarata]
MYSTSNDSSRSAKRRKLRLMCTDLTCDIEKNSDENIPNKYQLSDIKDSCQIEYNGQFIQFNVQQLKTIKKIGEGNFGIVTLTQLEHRPDVIFACKKMTLENHGNNSYSSESDLKAMRTVGNDRHPHIVHFYAALIDLIEGQLIICMEVLDTSLDKFYPILHSCFKPTNIVLDLFIRRLAKHIVLALDYLKSKNLIHRDIKPQNILVGRQSIFKLCDFGICGTLKDSLSSTHRGSLRYLPPERLGNVCTYGTRSDMWALGMTLFEISQGHLPLESESIMSFMYQIKNGWEPDVPLTLSQSTRDLLAILLRHDVNQRPRYYSNILSMESMINIQDNPSQDEIVLINQIIDLVLQKTPE